MVFLTVAFVLNECCAWYLLGLLSCIRNYERKEKGAE